MIICDHFAVLLNSECGPLQKALIKYTELAIKKGILKRTNYFLSTRPKFTHWPFFSLTKLLYHISLPPHVDAFVPQKFSASVVTKREAYPRHTVLNSVFISTV